MQEFKEHISLAERVKAVEVTDGFINSCKRMGAPIVAFGEGVEIYHKTRKGKQFAVKGDYIIDAGEGCYFVVPGIVFRSLYREVPVEAPPPPAPPESFLPAQNALANPDANLAQELGIGGPEDGVVLTPNDNDKLPTDQEMEALRAQKADELAQKQRQEEMEAKDDKKEALDEAAKAEAAKVTI